jgi:hypothetical protein
LVVAVSEPASTCIGEEVAEVQVYSNIAVVARPGYVRVVKYTDIEIEKVSEGSVKVRIANFRGEVSEYCAKRFTVHPFSVPTPLAVTR